MAGSRVTHEKLAWGIEFESPRNSGPFLLCSYWDRDRLPRAGEPSRALLFNTRKQARDWCRARREQYANHHQCKHWRFRAVRVRECVERA